MTKKFVCTVCGYIHEGPEPPERCPQCKAPASKFNELKEDAGLQFVTEHVIGIAKDVDPKSWQVSALTSRANTPRSECIWP